MAEQYFHTGTGLQEHVHKAEFHIKKQDAYIHERHAEIEELKKTKADKNESTTAKLRQQIVGKDSSIMSLKNEIIGLKGASKAFQAKFAEHVQAEVTRHLQADQK